jgi:hypothetical protein
MNHVDFENRISQFSAMVFDGPEAMAQARQQVTAAMDATFGIKRYTTTEGWLVGGLEGNGDVNQEGPKASPAWRQRIEKARREIEANATEHRVRMMADSINRDEVLLLLEEIRTWANSLKKQTCESGWIELTRHATS